MHVGKTWPCMEREIKKMKHQQKGKKTYRLRACHVERGKRDEESTERKYVHCNHLDGRSTVISEYGSKPLISGIKLTPLLGSVLFGRPLRHKHDVYSSQPHHHMFTPTQEVGTIEAFGLIDAVKLGSKSLLT